MAVKGKPPGVTVGQRKREPVEESCASIALQVFGLVWFWF